MSENGRKYLGQKDLSEEQWDRLLVVEPRFMSGSGILERWAGHIVEMKKKGRKDADGKWLPPAWGLYMQIAGKVGMAMDDHQVAGGGAESGRLDMEVFLLELDWERGICTIQVKLTSSLYGIRTGTATSRWDPVDPDRSAEATNPIETAETSALGRALGFYGYGILPGSGMASAEDMTRPAPPPVKRQAPAKPKEKDLDAKLTTTERGKWAAALRTKAIELGWATDAINELMETYAEEDEMTLRKVAEFRNIITEGGAEPETKPIAEPETDDVELEEIPF